MTGRLKWMAAALVALVLLAGCNLAAKVVVQPDGSGYYSVIMTVPNAPSHPGQALYAAVRKGANQSNVPLTVAPYTAGTNSGAKMTFHFLSLSDLNAESHRLASAGKGAIGVTISRDAHGWNFSASTARSLITPPGSNGAPGSNGLGAVLNSVISIDLIVQLPGSPGENNATSHTRTATTTTFTWVLSSAQSSAAPQASTTYVGNQANVKLATAMTPVASGTTSTGSSGTSGGTIALIAGAAVIVLGGAAVAIVLLRRRHATSASETTATSELD